MSRTLTLPIDEHFRGGPQRLDPPRLKNANRFNSISIRQNFLLRWLWFSFAKPAVSSRNYEIFLRILLSVAYLMFLTCSRSVASQMLSLKFALSQRALLLFLEDTTAHRAQGEPGSSTSETVKNPLIR